MAADGARNSFCDGSGAGGVRKGGGGGGGGFALSMDRGTRKGSILEKRQQKAYARRQPLLPDLLFLREINGALSWQVKNVKGKRLWEEGVLDLREG